MENEIIALLNWNDRKRNTGFIQSIIVSFSKRSMSKITKMIKMSLSFHFPAVPQDSDKEILKIKNHYRVSVLCVVSAAEKFKVTSNHSDQRRVVAWKQFAFFNLNTRTSPKQLLDGLDYKLNYSPQKILLLRISSVWVLSLIKQCSKCWKFNSMEATTHYECLIRFYPILSSSLSRLRIRDSRFRCSSQLTRSLNVGLLILDSYLGSLRVLLKSQHSVTWKALSWLDICEIAIFGEGSCLLMRVSGCF